MRFISSLNSPLASFLTFIPRTLVSLSIHIQSLLLLLSTAPCPARIHLSAMSSLASRNKNFRYASLKQLKNDIFRLPQLQTPSPTSASISASALYFATPHASKGSLALFPIEYPKWKRTDNPPTLAVSGAEISDFSFNPFNDSQLATGATDGLVKLWTVPKGGLPAGSSLPADYKSTGYDSVSCLRFHPTASGLLAVGHKTGAAILDLEAQKQAYGFGVEGYGKDVVSTAWSRQGEVLATLGKSGAVSLFDPRSAPSSVLSSQTYMSSQIKKPHQLLFTGSGPLSSATSSLALFGLSSSQRPIVHFFDARSSLSSPLLSLDLDFSNGYVLPVYDPDTNLLFVTVRGSSVVSVFELEQLGSGKVSAFPVHTSATESSGVKGMALISKRAVNTNDAEIDRLLLLSDVDIQPYSVQVPRKLSGFHEELYPPTQDCRTSASAAAWLRGEEALPVMVSMADVHESGGVEGMEKEGGAEAIKEKKEKARQEAEKAAELAKQQPQVYVAPVVHGYSRRDSDNNSSSSSAVNINAAKTYSASETRKQIESKLKKSIFVHTALKEPPTIHDTHYDLKLGAGLPLADNIRANSRFFAVPWSTLGGSAVAVFQLGKVGRAPTNQPCGRGHKSPATCFDLSGRVGQEEWMATGSQEGEIRVWKLPTEGLKGDLNEEWLSLACLGRVVTLRWHPYIDFFLVSSSSGFDGHLIEFWDLSCLSSSSSSSSSSSPSSISPSLLLNVHPDQVLDLSFHPASHLLATSCKDGKVRIINIAEKRVVREWGTPEGVRDTRVMWTNGGRNLLTCGFGNASARSISLWNAETGAKLTTVELDRVNNIPIPRYDEDTQLLFLCMYGSTTLHLYDCRDDRLEFLTSYTTSADATGFVFLPKWTVDVSKVEIMRALKLTKDAAQLYSFTVPRKRLEFFQDDVFVDTRDWKEEVMSGRELVEGRYGKEGKEGRKVSLNVKKLPLLTEAPEEELTERQKRYQQHLAQQAQPKSRGVLGHESAEEVRDHFKQIAATMPTTNRWDAKQEKKSEVDDDEWD